MKRGRTLVDFGQFFGMWGQGAFEPAPTYIKTIGEYGGKTVLIYAPSYRSTGENSGKTITIYGS